MPATCGIPFAFGRLTGEPENAEALTTMRSWMLSLVFAVVPCHCVAHAPEISSTLTQAHLLARKLVHPLVWQLEDRSSVPPGQQLA